jgi:acyl carrier protein
MKLYRILRGLGMKQNQINLLSLFNEELRLDKFDEICYINYLENHFNITIPDKDISHLGTINNTVEYVYMKTADFGGLN